MFLLCSPYVVVDRGPLSFEGLLIYIRILSVSPGSATDRVLPYTSLCAPTVQFLDSQSLIIDTNEAKKHISHLRKVIRPHRNVT